MTGIEPRTSGIVSNRSTNWATTTAHYFLSFVYFDEMLYNEGGTPPKGISTKKMRRHLCCHRRSLSNKKQLLMHQMDGWMTNHQNTSQMLSVKAIYFRLFSKKTANLIQLDSQSNCWRLDANRGCLVSETIALLNCATPHIRVSLTFCCAKQFETAFDISEREWKGGIAWRRRTQQSKFDMKAI